MVWKSGMDSLLIVLPTNILILRICFTMLKMPKYLGRPAHATWYVPRVSSPLALQALTCRLGAPAHPCNVRAFSYQGRCRSGDAPTLYNDFEALMLRWPGRPMPLGMCLEYAYHPLCKLLHVCLLYTSPSPRDGLLSRMPSSA